jgi:hypothetical protein
VKKVGLKGLTRSLWKCQCESGNIIFKTTNELTKNNVFSCSSCSIKSKGEWIIKTLLDKENIEYETQKTFNSCYRIKNHNFRFDFFLPKYNTCIEYDGISHYKANLYGSWNTRESVLDQQEKDKIKNQWCKENNVFLIRIPYFHLNEIEVKDLFPNTSKYLVL